MPASRKVQVGMKFHSPYADGNPEWEVIRPRGRGAWVCQISDKDADFSGTQKGFLTEEILHSQTPILGV